MLTRYFVNETIGQLGIQGTKNESLITLQIRPNDFSDESETFS